MWFAGLDWSPNLVRLVCWLFFFFFWTLKLVILNLLNQLKFKLVVLNQGPGVH